MITIWQDDTQDLCTPCRNIRQDRDRFEPVGVGPYGLCHCCGRTWQPDGIGWRH